VKLADFFLSIDKLLGFIAFKAFYITGEGMTL
jgi:hypothetical protein